MLVRRSAQVRVLQSLSMQRDLGIKGNPRMGLDLSSALLVQCIAEVIAGEQMPSSSHREHGAALIADLKTFVTLHADREIPLDRLGERFGISRRHITRLFRERTGFSIGAYQQGIRLQKARDLLIKTDLPIGDIALRVGFESGAALARTMRRVSGYSPSDVRGKMARSIKP